MKKAQKSDEPVDRKLAWIDFTTLKALDINPRAGHKVSKLEKSIQHHGFGSAITVNRTTGNVLSGNGRLKALAALKRKNKHPPKGIQSHGDRWLVPVLYDDWKEAEETRVALALNGGLNHSLEGDWQDEVIRGVMAISSTADLEALGIVPVQAEQYVLDHDTPTVAPTIDLSGIDALPSQNETQTTTLKMVVSETTGQLVRTICGQGVSAEELLRNGTQHYAANDGKRSRKATAKAQPPATDGKGRTGKRDRRGRATT